MSLETHEEQLHAIAVLRDQVVRSGAEIERLRTTAAATIAALHTRIAELEAERDAVRIDLQTLADRHGNPAVQHGIRMAIERLGRSS